MVDGTGITGQFTAKNGEVTWQYENPYRVIFTDVETNQQIDNTFPIYELTEIKRDGEIVTKAKIRFYIFAGYFCDKATEYEPKANTEHFELTFKVYDNYGYVTEEDAATIIINNVILVKE